MCITLKTLLAYLDDTLDAAKVKQIGQKIAESDNWQELIARIKQVTRRRRLTSPPLSGEEGQLDPNTIAEYLDDVLPEEKAAEVEQICLNSDVYLAEIAACHQIRALVTGEPILIPPTSQQRMYSIAKGPEAIPWRRPLREEEGEYEDTYEPDFDEDETLRMGLPALHKDSDWRSRLILIGGGLAACALLVLAIFQALRQPSIGDIAQNGKIIAEGPKDDTKKGGAQQEQKGEAEQKVDGQKKEPNGTKIDVPQKGGNGETKPNGKKTQETPGKKIPDQPQPIGPPSRAVEFAGKYLAQQTAAPSFLLQFDPNAKSWERVNVMEDKVSTGGRLVSLPGINSSVVTKNGIKLDMQGILTEQMFYPTPIRESVVELHDSDQVALDMTLHRGRVVLTNVASEPKTVRLRFANPTNPELDGVWDLTLDPDKGQVLVERWSSFSPSETFYRDPKNTNRVGPMASQHLVVLQGNVVLRENEKTTKLSAPPGLAWVQWNSFQGQTSAHELKQLPEWTVGQGTLSDKLPKEVKEQILTAREKMITARDTLAAKVAGSKSVGVALASALKSEDIPERVLAIRWYAAIDDLPGLVDAMHDEKRFDVRRTAIDVARLWITNERDNQYKLFAELKTKYGSEKTAEDIMVMLLPFTPQMAFAEATYETLIFKLNDPNIVLRELAAWHLYYDLLSYYPEKTAQQVLKINYRADAEARVRQEAQKQWQRLLTTNLLPPMPQATEKQS